MNTKLILAALMMSLSLAACGQKEPAEATTESVPPAYTAPAEAAPAESEALDSTMPADEADAAAEAEGDAAEPAAAE